MLETINELDEGLERLAAAGFELPNGFVNHGAMACEALGVIGYGDRIAAWAQRFARIGGTVVPAAPSRQFDWAGRLGDYDRLPEWIGLFQVAIAADGWPAVVETWVPRLLPGLGTKLFHGVIRTAHAIRAIAVVDTPPRQEELARALGYWAARYRPAQPTLPEDSPEDIGTAVLHAAGDAARRYVAQPNIAYLHGVTGAMAVEILVAHLPPAGAAIGLTQLHAEHAALFGGASRPRRAQPTTTQPAAAREPAMSTRRWDDKLVAMAVASGDPHQVKLVEACRRGFQADEDPTLAAPFLNAARTVTGGGV